MTGRYYPNVSIICAECGYAMTPVTPPPNYVVVCYYKPDCPQFGKPMRVKPIETEYVEVLPEDMLNAR